ncbi:MAG: hypothetical protein VXW22_02135 [Pseudomonadota bacterium]|nr:hypothetical protein [Pseudomonadota bacterium]
MHILIGAIMGVFIALLVGASLLGLVGFALFGALAGLLGAQRIGAVELFYWIMVLVQIILLALMWFGVSIPVFLVVLPVVLMISRLVAIWGTALVARFQA